MNRQTFADMHTPGSPLILFNVWDAGSAIAVAKAGAKAIATGSAALAGAQGYDDGEALPFAALLTTSAQIKAAVDLPLSVDIESGFDEGFGVVGLGGVEDLVDRALFDPLAVLHHDD